MTGVSDIQEAVAQIKAAGPSKPRLARDPVNQPMINNWVEAIGDRNPIYVDDAAARAAGHPGIVAPPAMIQVWTMMGLGGVRPKDDPLGPIIKLFDDAGYIGVVATNCEQTYHRYLLPGEQVSISAELGDVVGPKQTALGEGWFINQHIVWQVGDEDVAEMNWRILKFKPAGSPSSVPDDLDPDAMMRPSSSRDTAFFWDGVKAHELRIQRLADGSLRHPPVPAVWQDKSVPINYVVSQRSRHGVQLRGASRAESSGSHGALRDRAGGARGRGTHAGRAAGGRSCSCCDRYAGTSDLYRFPRLEPLRMGA